MHGCFWRSSYSLLVLLIVIGAAVWLLKSDSSSGIRDIDGLISQLHEPENKTRILYHEIDGGAGEILEFTPPMRQLISLGDAARQPLVRRLNEDGIQNEVALVLGEIGNEATVPVLIESFPEFNVPLKQYNYDDTDPALLNVVCFTKALRELTGQRIGSSELGTEFRAGLKQEWRNWWTNSYKTFWVKEYPTNPNRSFKTVPQILAQLDAALRDPDPRVRKASVHAYGELEHHAEPSVPNLIVALRDDNLEVRRAAASVFYWIGPAGSVATPALVNLIRTEQDHEIRVDSGLSLAKIGKAAIPSVKQLLDDPSPRVRCEAIRAIGCMDPKQTWAVPILLRLSKDTSSDVRGMAYVYMRVISPDDPAVLKSLILGLSDPDSEVRTDCARSLEYIGPNAAPATEKLLTLVDDADPEVRIAVWNAFEKMQTLDETHVPKLIAALADDTWEVRSEAAVILSKIGPPARSAVDALCKSLSDKQGQVRWWSAKALGAIGPEAKEAIPLLFQALSDEEGLVRTMAKEALFRIDRETAVKAWLE